MVESLLLVDKRRTLMECVSEGVRENDCLKTSPVMTDAPKLLMGFIRHYQTNPSISHCFSETVFLWITPLFFWIKDLMQRTPNPLHYCNLCNVQSTSANCGQLPQIAVKFWKELSTSPKPDVQLLHELLGQLQGDATNPS
jgi:hypothetical protein